MYKHQYVDEEIIIGGIKRIVLHFGFAILTAFVGMLTAFYYYPMTKFVGGSPKKLLILGFLIPFLISFLINRIPLSISKMAFFTYNVLTGLLMSYGAFKYGIGISIFSYIFAGGIFAIMFLFGYYTKEDLERYRVILKINMFFLICLFCINLYFGIRILHWIIAYYALTNFTALVGFDINHIKKEMTIFSKNEKLLERVRLTGTLQFYLDYLVLCIALISIFGKTFT